jgi:CBS-domain-containing membrane protein
VKIAIRFDRKVRRHPFRYVFQCALAGVATMALLVFLDLLTYRGLVAALGATTFLIFTMPHRVSCRPRYVIGGYVMGVSAGVLCTLAFAQPGALLFISSVFALGALSVGCASLLMVSTNTEHPPAAGVALGLVLQPWDYETVLYVLGCVCFLSLARYLLKRFMIDLL